jgi:hypothetical protein
MKNNRTSVETDIIKRDNWNFGVENYNSNENFTQGAHQ